MSKERESGKRKKEVPEILGQFSLLVTKRLGDYIDARNSGGLPTKEAREAKAKELLKGLSVKFQAELLREIDLFEAIQTVCGKREKRKKWGKRGS